MESQAKYVVQGCLLMLLSILIFRFVLFISSVRLIEPEPSVIDYVDEPDQNISSYTEGQELFYANCASCHAINKRLTGPALAGFQQRGPWKDRKQVYAWIRSPEVYMKHNICTRSLYKEYQVLMTQFPNLTHKEIDAIIDVVNRKGSYY